MNRQQRRANKVKNHDPVYMVRESDFRAHIDRLLKTDQSVREAVHREADRVMAEEAKKQEKDINALVLLALRRCEKKKWGRKKLLHFYKTMCELHNQYWDSYGDCDRLAMKMHLKNETGIDIDNLDEEVAKYVKEPSTTEG